MSTPNTLLLHIDGSARLPVRLRVARELAQAFGGRVVGQYCVTPSILRYPLAIEGASVTAAAIADYDDECYERARAAFAQAAAGAPELTWSDLRTDGYADMVRAAFYADVLLLGQRNPNDPAADETPPDFVPSLLVETGRPALVLPYAVEPGPAAGAGGTVLVAWKETRESARAVAAALPWLARAKHVKVAAVPGAAARLLAYLKQHGIAAEAVSAPRDGADAGELLLSLAADAGADLLVMGCYGHARSREFVFGGATRTVLHSMTLPVLMVH